MRPFSIMGIGNDGIDILVKVVGCGSSFIASRRKGDSLSYIGPLGGSTFPIIKSKSATVIAGGTGLATAIFLISYMRNSGFDKEISLLYGAESEEELCIELVRGLDVDLHLATMDGSTGFKGDVVGLLKKLISEGEIDRGVCYSCGPRGMVKAIEGAKGDFFDAHYTSLESVMACGVGACRGCTIPIRDSGRTVLKTVCSDGPVFDASLIDWEGWSW